MKATLTIEVPDDFKKGDCSKCELSESYYFSIRCLVLDTTDYELCRIDCPLEIQDIPEDIPMEYFENGGI